MEGTFGEHCVCGCMGSIERLWDCNLVVLLNKAVCVNRAAIVRDSFWAVVYMAVLAVSSGYGMGYLAGTVESVCLCCIEWLCRRIFGVPVNVGLFAGSN